MNRKDKKGSTKATNGHLTPEQRSALDLLIQGKGDQAAADAVGVHRPVVWKWRHYDPFFQAELNRQRQQLYQSGVDQLRSLIPKAVKSLDEELERGDHRLQAAVHVLKMVGLDKLEQPTGRVDAEAIIDDRVFAQKGASPELIMRRLNGGHATESERQTILEDLEQRMSEE